MNVNTKPESTFKLEAVHPDPSQAHKMPYAPAMEEEFMPTPAKITAALKELAAF